MSGKVLLIGSLGSYCASFARPNSCGKQVVNNPVITGSGDCLGNGQLLLSQSSTAWASHGKLWQIRPPRYRMAYVLSNFHA